MRAVLLRVLIILVFTSSCSRTQPVPPALPALPAPPASVAEFRTAVQRVLDETGIPGAGIALVRQNGIEWAGGVGLADRDAKTPVTADTHFRAGSISKTFVAMALVQLSQDGDLYLDTPVSELAPKVRIVNPWNSTDPVRVIHLLEHTAGFDDMHFNEAYNLVDPSDLSLEEVLRINPRSRVVRWQPGTRMSYSNPGYTVAAYVLEQATGEKYEDIIQKKIFEPIGMKTSSFRLADADKAMLARGYAERSGAPVPFSQIYLRPSGNLHTSAADLGAFVHVLLNWGELPGKLIVDPEYLSNMEHPRTTLASRAGLLNGYGSAIRSQSREPFPLLGHDGGIEGFISRYAYSPSRDVGFVVLLNGAFSGRAMERISDLAIRYLKSDVEPPAKSEIKGEPVFMDRFAGYYHDSSPRNQVMAFATWLQSGQTISVGDRVLVSQPVLGSPQQLIPVGEGLFRLASEMDATRVFAADSDGNMVLSGVGYSVRRPRWRVEIVRLPVVAAALILVSPLLVGLFWIAHATRAAPRGFWTLKTALLFAALCPLPLALAIARLDVVALGQIGLRTATIYASTLLLPFAAVLASTATVFAWTAGAGRWLRVYALAVACSAIVVSAYLYSWGMIGFKTVGLLKCQVPRVGAKGARCQVPRVPGAKGARVGAKGARCQVPVRSGATHKPIADRRELKADCGLIRARPRVWVLGISSSRNRRSVQRLSRAGRSPKDMGRRASRDKRVTRRRPDQRPPRQRATAS